MGRGHNTLDIILASDVLYFRGTGVDVEPAVLRGSVVLNLVEPTTFKEITLQLRGQSHVPNNTNDGSPVLTGGMEKNVFFLHKWSFLEGELKHSPTLKAGRHAFPFQLELQCWLPSSLFIHSGLGVIQYKLHATAVRPVFLSNLHASTSVRIVRSFTWEALEYQQSLDLENTWPGKLMYSLMLPHKAWAAGDTITSLLKFSPLIKGVRITHITTTIQQFVKINHKAGPSHEENCTISTAKYELRDGRAVLVSPSDQGEGVCSGPQWSAPPTPSRATPLVNAFPADPSSTGAHRLSNGEPPFRTSSTLSVDSGESGSPLAESGHHLSPTHPNGVVGEEEVITTVSLTLPVYAAPTHALEPLMVSYRICWSILMTNPDNHISELRCLLPIHVLDPTLLEDARGATRATRHLLLGLGDVPTQDFEEIELPSYPAHVLDRVANAYLPATRRVSNPWMNGGGDAACSPPPPGVVVSPPASATPSSPLAIRPQLSFEEMRSAGAVALDLVDSELQRLGQGSGRRSESRASHLSTASSSAETSLRGSRSSSRASSRSGSPERASGSWGRERSHRRHSSLLLKPFMKVASSLHHSGQNNRHQRHHVGAADGTTGPSTPPTPVREGDVDGNESVDRPGLATDEEGATARTFNEVPHYDVASQGFLGGGVTPLSSMRGLPSYEEAELTPRGVT